MRPDVHVSVRRTSGRVRQPHGRPPDGMPSATLPGGRHGGRPSDRRTACRPPPHPADGMADGHPTTSRPLRPSARAVHLAKTLESITIDLEVRIKRVIPFWNVQVMLYNMGY
jgi:hypothetical protein